MERTQTPFDLLHSVAREVGAMIVAGALAPPMDGRMWIGKQSLEELLLPDGAPRMVMLLLLPGGPPERHATRGHGFLSDEGQRRLSEVATAAGARVLRGRLALLTPETWLDRGQGASVDGPVEEPYGTAANPRPHPDNVQGRGVDHDPVIEHARAHGWPANFGNYPTLFLDDRPLFNIMAQENVGRDVVLVVGRLEE